MSPLGKVITLAALSCPLAWAGWVVKPGVDCDIDTGCEIPLEAIVCAEGPCMEENDETSLLQAQSTFAQGRERLQEDGPKYVWTQAGIEHIKQMPKVMEATSSDGNNLKPGDELTEQVIKIMTDKLAEKGGPTFEELIGKAFTKESLLQKEWPTDAGDVTGAFDRNLEKERLPIDSKVAHDLEFQDAHADDKKVYYRKCEQRSPFCDMRLNLKDQMTYETEWVLAYLDKFGELEPGNEPTKFGAPEAFTLFVDRYKEKLEQLNKREGAHTFFRHCAYLHTYEEFKAHLLLTGHQLIQPGELGRFYANWMSNIWVNWKKASDAIGDAGEPGKPAICSWTQNEKGWGTTTEVLKTKIRTGFMWDDAKGRGTAEDRLSMTSGAPRDILNYISADAWVAEYDKMKDDADLCKANHALPLPMKAALPGVERWAMTFKNRRLGFFSYGDTPSFISKDANGKDYFFEQIVHGFGIHGRSTSPGNPADRFRYVGMPWIGGVSGSVVDFYIAAKELGFSGKTLTDMVMSDVAFLAAAGQHSVSELVFACTSIFLEGPKKSEDEMSEADEDLKKEADYDDQKHPFKIESWRELVNIMNKEVKEGEDWKGDHDLPALFNMAMREFMKLSNHGWVASRSPFAMEHTLTANLGKLEDIDSGSACLKEPGLEYFKRGLENRGGIDSAFQTWTSEDTAVKNSFGLAIEQGGLTEAKFIELISAEGGFNRTSTTEIKAIIANIEDTRIRSLLKLKNNDEVGVFADENGVSQEDLKKAESKEAVIKLVVKKLAATHVLSQNEILGFLTDADGLSETAIAAKKLLERTLDRVGRDTLSEDFSLTDAWEATIANKVKALYTCLTAQGTRSLTKDAFSAFYWTAWKNDQPVLRT